MYKIIIAIILVLSCTTANAACWCYADSQKKAEHPKICQPRCEQTRCERPQPCQPTQPVCKPVVVDCPAWLFNRMKFWCDLSKVEEIEIHNTSNFVCIMRAEKWTCMVNILQWKLSDEDVIAVADKVRKEYGNLKVFKMRDCSYNYIKGWK